ncbi:MAG: ABC transporter ATP-binding protein [Phycisphaeraceae bacterium]
MTQASGPNSEPAPNPLKLLTVRQQEEQEAEERPLDFRLIRRLFTYTRPYRAKRNLLLLIVLTRSMQLPLLTWAMAAVIAGPIAQGTQMTAVMWGALGFFALALMTQGVLHFRHRLALELGEQVVHDMRRDIFEHLQRLSMSFYNRTKLGRIISRMTSDAEAVRVGVQDVLFITLVQMGQGLVAASVMLWYDWRLFMLLLLMAPVIWGISAYFRRRLSQTYRVIQESFSRVTSSLAESVSGIRVTQGFVREDVNAQIFSRLVEDHSNYSILQGRQTGALFSLLDLNSQIFTAGLLALGGYFVLVSAAGDPAEQLRQYANLFVFFAMANLFFSPFRVLGAQYNAALTAMAGAERVFRFLDTKPDFVDPPDAIDMPPTQGRVEFRNVRFAYEAGRPVLNDINFIAKPGTTVALVGHTGSGKTTIINLISKFYLPTGGELLIDGYDVTKVSTESLQRQMGIVLQVNFLFTGTVLDNILVGRSGATEQEVIEACRKLDVLDLIEALPEGFHTQVGEGGRSMSLGQRQIVCFARAMLADPRIMILDEATSSVDTMTEARIQKALSVLLKSRTSFVVAHRLSTIQQADMILVLDQGWIVERGTHRQLLATGGVYASMYRRFIHAARAASA